MNKNSSTDDSFFEAKKVALANAVLRYCQMMGIAPLIVRVAETPCPNSSSDDIAHIHLEEGIICISKGRLMSLNLDDIEEVARHEVAHVWAPHHGVEHEKIQTFLSMKSFAWSNFTGTVRIEPGAKDKCAYCGREEVLPFYCHYCGLYYCSEHRLPEKHECAKLPMRMWKAKGLEPRKIREGECSYHSCDKPAKVECPHCHKRFCEEHAQPMPPYLPDFDSSGVMSKLEREKWREGQSHPCPPYYDYLQSKKKEESNGYWRALEKLRSKPAGRDEPPHSKPKREVPRKARRTLKCILGIHRWTKVGGPSRLGKGKFVQKYICEKCGKIKSRVI
ncbi:MAG: AN1-type zinc finger domain-containing protein [Candidatus Hadarchaeales archaeon]